MAEQCKMGEREFLGIQLSEVETKKNFSHTEREKNERRERRKKAHLFGERRDDGGVERERHSTCSHMELHGPHGKNKTLKERILKKKQKQFGRIYHLYLLIIGQKDY